MIPVNNLAASLTAATQITERKDHQGLKVVATPTVVEDDGDINEKRNEAAKVVKRTDEIQAIARDEERGAKDQSQDGKKRENPHIDITV